jgi:hypothetical protein
MAFAPTVKVAQGKDVVSRQMDESGNSVLLHLRSGYVYTCGEVGTFIWNALEKPATVGDLVQKICAEFDVEEAVALDDLQRFLKDLVAERLVTVDDKPHA